MIALAIFAAIWIAGTISYYAFAYVNHDDEALSDAWPLAWPICAPLAIALLAWFFGREALLRFNRRRVASKAVHSGSDLADDGEGPKPKRQRVNSIFDVLTRGAKPSGVGASALGRKISKSSVGHLPRSTQNRAPKATHD